MDFPYIDIDVGLRGAAATISRIECGPTTLSPATRRNDCCIRDGKWGLIKFTNLSVWWSSISRKFVNGVVVLATTPSRLIMEGYESIPNLFLRPRSNVMSSVSFQLSTRRQRSAENRPRPRAYHPTVAHRCSPDSAFAMGRPHKGNHPCPDTNAQLHVVSSTFLCCRESSYDT